MRKFFFLIPAMLLSLAMSATIHEIGPGDPETVVNDKLTDALENANDNDVIILTDGIYNESSNYIVFNKNVEVKAAEGAHPVVKVVHYLKVSDGKHAIIDGLSFDGTVQGDGREQYFRFYEGENILEVKNCTFTGIKKNIFRCESGKKFALLDVKNCTFSGSLSDVMKLESNLCGAAHFDGCEFNNTADIVIYGKSSSHLDECIVNDCYFHNNTQQSIYFEASETEGTETCDALTVTNSTFTNTTALSNWISIIDIRPYGSANTDAIKVRVDHCTFYNNPCVDSGHANIRTANLSDVEVSNCIFMHPTELAQRATYCSGGGKVSNCVTYNFTKDPNNYAHAYGPTVTYCAIINPHFTDAANADFTFASDWTNMTNLSPACGNATDGTDLGDPRWHTNANLTTLSLPYNLDGNKANLLGNIRLTSVDSIQYYDKEITGIASWKIHVENGVAINATIDMAEGSNSGTTFKIMAFDAKGNKVDSLVDEWRKTHDDIVMPGSMYLPKGDFIIRLYNEATYSKALVDHIQLSYCGGAVQAIPGTTNINEAWYSGRGTRADGMISFDSYSNQWVKWNVAFEETVQKMFDVTLNINNPSKYGHRFSVNIYEDETAEPIATLSESSWNESFDADAPLALHLGSVLLQGGKTYLVKVTNAESGAQPKVISVDFAYSGGNVIDIASDANTTLPVADAWFTSTCLREDGKIEYHSDNANSWIKWNIATDENAFYDITANISTTQAHGFTVAIYEDETAEPITSVTEGTWVDTKGDLALGLGRINLAGNKKYVVKVINATDGSKAKLVNVVFAPVVATVTALPGTLEPSDAILSSLAWVDTEGTVDSLLFTPRGDEGHASNSAYTTAEFGKWKVSVDENSKFVFTANVLSLNGHNFRISVLDETESSTIYTKQEAETGHYDFHNEGSNWQVVTASVNLAAGTYIVKIENYKDSKGRVLNIVAERATITLDEMAENNTVISDNAGYAADIQLTRSYATGVYNTICLPFNVDNNALKAVFGNDVELLEMGSATLEGAVLNLNFDAATDLQSGKPYLIRSSQDIVNPTFTAATITETVAQTTAGIAADFIGTFIKNTIDASENNLYLGTDNKLYFSNNDVTIKGLRAYFNVNIPNPQQVIKHARIVTQGQVVTDVELVGAENQGILKKIENGQVIIIRDGILYNVLGTKIQ